MKDEQAAIEVMLEIRRVLDALDCYMNTLDGEYCNEFDEPTEVRLNPPFYERLRDVIREDKKYLNRLYDRLEVLTALPSLEVAESYAEQAQGRYDPPYVVYQKYIDGVYYLCVGPQGYDREYPHEIVERREVVVDANTAPIDENDERSCFLREKLLVVDGREVEVSLANFYPGSYTDSIDAVIAGKIIKAPWLKRFEI